MRAQSVQFRIIFQFPFDGFQGNFFSKRQFSADLEFQGRFVFLDEGFAAQFEDGVVGRFRQGRGIAEGVCTIRAEQQAGCQQEVEEVLIFHSKYFFDDRMRILARVNGL